MASLLDVRSLLRSRREERTTDVFEMARRLARNESVDPDDVITAMTVAGMDDDALADLVDMIARRTDYRAKASTQAAAETELASVRGAISRQREAFDEAERRYRLAVEPLLDREHAAEAKVREAVNAANALTMQANLPADINDRVEAARKAYQDAESNLRKVQGEIDTQERRVEHGLAVVDREGGFDKCAARYDDTAHRPNMRIVVQEAVADIRGGRYRLSEAGSKLDAAVAARDAAKAAYEAAEKAARDF